MKKKKKCKNCGRKHKQIEELWIKLVAFDEQAKRQIARINELKEQLKIHNSS